MHFVTPAFRAGRLRPPTTPSANSRVAPPSCRQFFPWEPRSPNRHFAVRHPPRRQFRPGGADLPIGFFAVRHLPPQTSASGAPQFSPARKRWVPGPPAPTSAVGAPHLPAPATTLGFLPRDRRFIRPALLPSITNRSAARLCSARLPRRAPSPTRSRPRPLPSRRATPPPVFPGSADLPIGASRFAEVYLLNFSHQTLTNSNRGNAVAYKLLSNVSNRYPRSCACAPITKSVKIRRTPSRPFLRRA